MKQMRIVQLHAVEKEARGSPPDQRADLRKAQAKPIFDDLETWLHAQLPSISGKSPLQASWWWVLLSAQGAVDLEVFLETLSDD